MPSTGFRRRADLSGVFRISDRSVLVMSAEAAGSVEAGVKRQITAIEATILEQVQADPDLAQRFAILTSIQGLSAITAFALLIEIPELGGLEPAQAAGLAGLAPVARQPGRWTGRAFIRGDRASVRQAAYIPALVATRFNPHMTAQYEQLTMPGSLPRSPSPPSCES
jgi:transposase